MKDNGSYKHRYLTGFTFIELIITVVIVGVLATVAIFVLNGAVERSYGMKAASNLRLISLAVDKYMHDNPGMEIGCTNLNEINVKYGLNLNDNEFDYNMIGDSSSGAYDIIATRNSGPYKDTFMSVADSEPVAHGTWPWSERMTE